MAAATAAKMAATAAIAARWIPRRLNIVLSCRSAPSAPRTLQASPGRMSTHHSGRSYEPVVSRCALRMRGCARPPPPGRWSRAAPRAGRDVPEVAPAQMGRWWVCRVRAIREARPGTAGGTHADGTGPCGRPFGPSVTRRSGDAAGAGCGTAGWDAARPLGTSLCMNSEPLCVVRVESVQSTGSAYVAEAGDGLGGPHRACLPEGNR